MDLQSTYDVVPYESYAYQQTHPDRLASVAILFGMEPPPVDRCRVLELGGASGGNLIPMAVALPEASFLGVDLSERQIKEGRRTVAELGLSNIELRHQSITDLPDKSGPFDYVISHGVYSWVPPDVQKRILEIASRTLTPHGVAYVSYNTNPGWQLRGAIRDMMLYHSSRFDDPGDRVRQSHALLDFLASSVPDKGGPYEQLLQSELKLLRGKPGSYLFHEHLEENNEAIYFHEFVARARAANLQYLGETNVASMAANSFPEDVRSTLERVSSDIVQAEQYMDFLRYRMFRQTLLCHAGVPLRRSIGPEALRKLRIASPARPVEPDPAPRDETRVRFESPNGNSLETGDPRTKAALLALAEVWPDSLSFGELVDEARRQSGAEGPKLEDERLLGNRLLQVFVSSSLLELRVLPSAFTTQVSSRPLASPLARLQARSQDRVTNLRHETQRLSQPQRWLIALLDGSRDHPSLAESMADVARRGEFSVSRKSGGEVTEEELPHVAGDVVSDLLHGFARAALLQA